MEILLKTVHGTISANKKAVFLRVYCISHQNVLPPALMHAVLPNSLKEINLNQEKKKRKRKKGLRLSLIFNDN